MSNLKAALLSALDNAFNALDTLGTDVLFSSVGSTKFDFKKGAQRINTAPGVIIKGFIKPAPMLGPGDSEKVVGIFRTADIPSPNLYDSAVFNGYEWTILPEILNNGFTVTLKMSRGKRVES